MTGYQGTEVGDAVRVVHQQGRESRLQQKRREHPGVEHIGPRTGRLDPDPDLITDRVVDQLDVVHAE